jgi:ADP-ribosylglycohydrolase
MDGLKLALHILYHCPDLELAVWWAVLNGGDSDSVAAIVGQIGGAYFGIPESFKTLYREKIAFYENYTVLTQACKLF